MYLEGLFVVVIEYQGLSIDKYELIRKIIR